MANETDNDVAEAEGFTEAEESQIIAIVERVVARIIPGSHAEAEARTERRLDRPSTVEEQVKAELAKARADQDRAAAAEAEKSERQTLREQVAKLAEVKPEPPERRSTRVMWGSAR